MRKYASIPILWLIFSPALLAETTHPRSCAAQSGNSTVALLELYTSEGCSSCPPADAWLAGLTGRGLTSNQVVPLAFHVDYWNYLNWTDPYSQKIFSQRQYAQAKRNRLRSVYTPQVLLNGRDLPRWQSAAEDMIRRTNGSESRANLALTLTHQAQKIDIVADVRAKNDVGGAEMYVAIYENNLINHIEAGENQGLDLHHNFVVRKLIGPIALDPNNAAHFKQEVILESSWKKNDMGVALFAQNRGNGEILQALALPFCR